MKTGHISVGDIIATPGHVCERLYAVESICLGAINQESVIELKAIDRSVPDAPHMGKVRMFMPHEMIEAGVDSGIFKHTKGEQ